MLNSKMPTAPIRNSSGFPTVPEAVTEFERSCIGLTKLEHFAGLAMQGLYANPQWCQEHWITPEDAASEAVLAAKALLEELEKQP